MPDGTIVIMISEADRWPQYASPYDALAVETNLWGDRLKTARDRYAELDGELPHAVGGLAIGIVDGIEPPEDFSMLRVYSEQKLDPESFGVLLLVNFEGKRPP